MDGASLGFNPINRPAAGRCVFISTSLPGQGRQDIHVHACIVVVGAVVQEGFGQAGRQACVRACYSARTLLGWVYKKYSIGHDTTAHPRDPCNAWRGTVYVLY